ncbi:MAG: hypothetical protein M3322_11365 [Actinomycetota bacterium]|nr:hypothetical protein [Actinomycetota bacterium]
MRSTRSAGAGRGAPTLDLLAAQERLRDALACLPPHAAPYVKAASHLAHASWDELRNYSEALIDKLHYDARAGVGRVEHADEAARRACVARGKRSVR